MVSCLFSPKAHVLETPPGPIREDSMVLMRLCALESLSWKGDTKGYSNKMLKIMKDITKANQSFPFPRPHNMRTRVI